ncbi:MAG: hypothetical protein V4604_00045 [Bacteroidota bacterium]
MKYLLILFTLACSSAFSQKSDCEKYVTTSDVLGTTRTKATCFFDRSQNVLNMNFLQKGSTLFLEIENNSKGVSKKIVLDTIISIRFVFIDSSDFTIKMSEPEVEGRTADHIYPFNTVALSTELLDKLSTLAIEQVIIENPFGFIDPAGKIVFSIPKGYQSRVTKIAKCFQNSLN